MFTPAPTPITTRRLSRRTALTVGLAAASLAPMPWVSPRTLAQPSTSDALNEASFSPSDALALTEIVAQHLKQGAIPGALAGLWYPGPTSWVAAMGIGNLTTATPIAIDDHVRIASITKTFTATVVLQLVGEGKLSLDDRLEPFVSGIANGEQITIRQLLNMTAGVFDYMTDPVFGPAYRADPEIALSREQAVEIMRQQPAEFAPGARVHYSNSTTYLLGLIIEHLTGQSAGKEITERIIDPLELTGTSFPTTPEMPAPYAHGYDALAPGDPLRDVTSSNPAVYWTAGAMISTLADLHTWARALANGTLLSSALQQERLMTQAMPESRPGNDLRYGIGLADAQRDDRAPWQHSRLQHLDAACARGGGNPRPHHQSQRHHRRDRPAPHWQEALEERVPTITATPRPMRGSVSPLPIPGKGVAAREPWLLAPSRVREVFTVPITCSCRGAAPPVDEIVHWPSYTRRQFHSTPQPGLKITPALQRVRVFGSAGMTIFLTWSCPPRDMSNC